MEVSGQELENTRNIVREAMKSRPVLPPARRCGAVDLEE